MTQMLTSLIDALAYLATDPALAIGFPHSENIQVVAHKLKRDNDIKNVIDNLPETLVNFQSKQSYLDFQIRSGHVPSAYKVKQMKQLRCCLLVKEALLLLVGHVKGGRVLSVCDIDCPLTQELKKYDVNLACLPVVRTTRHEAADKIRDQILKTDISGYNVFLVQPDELSSGAATSVLRRMKRGDKLIAIEDPYRGWQHSIGYEDALKQLSAKKKIKYDTQASKEITDHLINFENYGNVISIYSRR